MANSSSTTSTRDQDEILREMVNSLSEDEKEGAAKSSYKYFLMTIKSSDNSATIAENGKSIVQFREEMTMAMAKRYLVAENGNFDSALTKMKNTIEYRKNVNVDAMRLCCYETEIDDDALAEMKAMLDRQYQNPCIFVRGYDKMKSVVYHVHVSEKTIFHPTDFVKMHVYMGDRASACTERMSEGTEDKWITMINYNGFSIRNSPSLSVTKDLLACLQDHFPERMGKCYLVDAPLIFRGIWKVIYPFIDPITKSKIVFVTGEAEKRATFSNVIDANQSMPFAHPEGKLTGPVDMKKFLCDTPYDHAYGEC